MSRSTSSRYASEENQFILPGYALPYRSEEATQAQRLRLFPAFSIKELTGSKLFQEGTWKPLLDLSAFNQQPAVDVDMYQNNQTPVGEDDEEGSSFCAAREEADTEKAGTEEPGGTEVSLTTNTGTMQTDIQEIGRDVQRWLQSISKEEWTKYAAVVGGVLLLRKLIC